MRFFILLFSFVRNVLTISGVIYFFRLFSYPYSLQFVYINEIIKRNKYSNKQDVWKKGWKTKNLFTGFVYMLLFGFIIQAINIQDFEYPLLPFGIFVFLITIPFQLLLLPLPKVLRSKTYFNKQPLWAYIVYFFCFGIWYLILPLITFF